MNRRDFCQMMAAAGAAAVSVPNISFAQETHAPAEGPIEALQQMDNEHLKVTVFSDASAVIVDKKNNETWRMGRVALQEESPIDIGHVWLRSERSICEQYPGRFAGQREGEHIRFTLLDRLRNKKGSFLAQVRLDGPRLEYRLVDIDRNLPSLVFPPPIECASLVLPMHLGRWIRQPLTSRYFLTLFSHLNMRWFGGLRANKGWLALFPEANFVDSGVMAAELTASPGWLTSLGQWNEPRVVRYTFLQGSYVELAKKYREWAIEQGLHKSLQQKIKEAPALGNLARGRMISLMVADAKHDAAFREDIVQPTDGDTLLGDGVRVNLTFAEVKSLLNKLPSAGLEHGMVNVRGWINGGYDYSHPDPWPPEPKLGSIGELREIAETSGPFTVALHDNYQDIYDHVPSWPKGVNRNRNGVPMAGGYWGGGQAYIINARNGLQLAKRNWRQIEELKPRAIFLDTVTAVQMYQSWEPGNLLTRTQDVTCKQELLKFFKSQNVAVGSEEGADFGVPYADWYENRHGRQPGESVPLWPLVFHDAIMNGRYVAMEGERDWLGGAQKGSPYPSWLLDMLWGYFLITWVSSADQVSSLGGRVASTKHVDDWFAQVATASMIDHRFLTDDESLEMSAFSTGDAIIVNFAPEPQPYDGIVVPGHGYKTLRV